MSKLLASAAILAAVTTAANACAPAPRCYLSEGKDYLRTICRQDMKAGSTVRGIIDNAEPELADETKADAVRDARAYIAGCKKLGINFPAR
jgi:hypothetical protein